MQPASPEGAAGNAGEQDDAEPVDGQRRAGQTRRAVDARTGHRDAEQPGQGCDDAGDGEPPRDACSYPGPLARAGDGSDKVVYSTTLTAVSTTTTRLERDFDPDAVQELKAAATSDLTIGGANLAARAMQQAWSTNVSCSSGP